MLNKITRIIFISILFSLTWVVIAFPILLFLTPANCSGLGGHVQPTPECNQINLRYILVYLVGAPFFLPAKFGLFGGLVGISLVTSWLFAFVISLTIIASMSYISLTKSRKLN